MPRPWPARSPPTGRPSSSGRRRSSSTSSIAQAGRAGHLEAVIVGAEKCPECAVRGGTARGAPGAESSRGTASPSAHRWSRSTGRGQPRPAAGRPLPGVEACVVDLETGHKCRQGADGNDAGRGALRVPRLHRGRAAPVRGTAREGWYITGDLVEMDPAGEITLPGPAEAVPEGGGRDDLAAGPGGAVRARYPPTKMARGWRWRAWKPRMARSVVLFTTEPITLRDANAAVTGQGHSAA